MKIRIVANATARINGKATPVLAGEVYEDIDPKDATTLLFYNMAELEGPAKVKILFDDVLEGFRRGGVIELKPMAAESLIKAGKAEIYNPDGQLPQEEGEHIKVKILYNTSIRGIFVNEGEICTVKPSIATELIRCTAGTLTDTGVERIKVKFLGLEAIIADGKQHFPNTVAELPASEAEALVKKNRAEF